MDGDTRKQFRRAVIAAVDAYFDARGLSRKGNLALYLQVGLFFVLILAGYLYLLFSAPANGGVLYAEKRWTRKYHWLPPIS